MKKILLPLLTALALCSCSKEKSLFSGRVAYVFYENESGGTKVITRFSQGVQGTSTTLNEDVWVDVYDEWIRIVLKNRNDYTTIIPRERVLRVVVETKEGNELNIPGLAVSSSLEL
ncbi:MAG: hypothetical protein AAGH89_08590 [Verrucomicrobiota bacterium]